MKKFANIYLTVAFLLLYLPIFYLIFYAFNEGGDMNELYRLYLGAFSSMLSDSRLMLILAQTFLLAF